MIRNEFPPKRRPYDDSPLSADSLPTVFEIYQLTARCWGNSLYGRGIATTLDGMDNRVRLRQVAAAPRPHNPDCSCRWREREEAAAPGVPTAPDVPLPANWWLDGKYLKGILDESHAEPRENSRKIGFRERRLADLEAREASVDRVREELNRELQALDEPETAMCQESDAPGCPETPDLDPA